jgi:pyruvate/2-oxoglutarate dehydrogenase complex dihydrolipoamide acyltransferase (E2) component
MLLGKSSRGGTTVPQASHPVEKNEGGIRQMSISIVWVALCLAGGSLVLSTVTLLIAWRVLQSAHSSERAGEERLEILREQQQRLEFMREERRLALEELERQHMREQQERLAVIRGIRGERRRLLEELERQRSGSEERLKEKPAQEEEGGGEGEEVVEQPAERSLGQPGGDPEATDAAKRKAEELGVDLWQVQGSGAEGRITVTDVRRAAANRRMTRHRG